MTTKNTKPSTSAAAVADPKRKLILMLILTALAFVLSYGYAIARSAPTGDPLGIGVQPSGAVAGAGCGMSGGSGGGGCCGGGGGAPVEGTATIEGDVQRIAVDTSSGSFSPNVIKAKAGVPIELAFSQAPGGCLAGVLFPDFDIYEDLTAGGKTIKLPALESGEYQFFCQMQMVSATLVVE